MKGKLREILNEILYRLLSIFGPAFSSRKISPRLLIRHVFIQKILRINSHVLWPVHWTTHVSAPQKINRGSRFPGLSRGCHLDGRNGIILGKNVWIGPRVSLISMNHDINNYHEYVSDEPIVVGDNCWLGANAIVLPGVKLGNHVVVAAGAVVTKSFPTDNVLLAGVPAQIIKSLDSYQE
jgi:acetyltransferase-like isoleucine patch superfamily enzyme